MASLLSAPLDNAYVNNPNYSNNNLRLLTPVSPMSRYNPADYVPRSTVPSLAKYSVPAMLAFMGIDKAIGLTKQAYLDKMADLGIGKDAVILKDAIAESPVLGSVVNYIANPTDSPAPYSDSDNLLSILKGSSNNVHNVGEAFLAGSNLVSQSVEKVHAMLSLANDTNVAYLDAILNVMIDRNNLTFSPSPVPLDEVSIAYLDANLTAIQDLVASVQNMPSSSNSTPLNVQFPDVMDVNIKRSENEIALTDKKLEHITYETTPVQMDNIQDDIPMLTPQQMRALKDAVVAKKNSDENTFEVNEDDIDDMFGGGIPDISEIFTYSKKTDRLPTEY